MKTARPDDSLKSHGIGPLGWTEKIQLWITTGKVQLRVRGRQAGGKGSQLLLFCMVSHWPLQTMPTDPPKALAEQILLITVLRRGTFLLST